MSCPDPGADVLGVAQLRNECFADPDGMPCAEQRLLGWVGSLTPV